MDFGPGIKVHLALFVAFAENNALTVLKVHIVAILAHKFADADAGGRQ